MRQIPLLQGKALLVELPKGLGEYNMFLWDAYYDVTGDFHEVPSLTSTHKDPDKTRILLPEGNWRIIGMLSEVTEEQNKQVVEFFTTDEEFGSEDVFRDYLNKSFHDTAIESLESAIIAEGYYLDANPHKDPGLIPSAELQAYREAQSRVLSRKRCLILRRMEE